MNDNDPQHATRWDAVDEAAERLREGDHQGALAELRAVLDRDPANAYAHYFTGAAQFELGEFEAARAAYQQALVHAPEYLGALVGLGHALRLQGRLEEAVRAGEQALAMGPQPDGDADAHYLLGLTYSERGETRLAVRHLEAFLASNPEFEVHADVQSLIQKLTGGTKPLDVAKS